ncbi:hypothetical protein BaRGS_00022447 [Batillaria attramentaria]|uniref:Monocarboxylate transporter n=1 Tax=Batillaria attramentaria TaxID=370345 RepID=A0ABD0KH97_9CAEN
MSSRDKDGGWAWVVLCACASCTMMTSGLAILAGIFQKEFLEHFDGGVVLTSWITSLFASQMQLGGPLAGLMSSLISCRASVMTGAVFLTVGLLLSAFSQNITALLITFGVSGGLGLGLIYSAAVVAVNFSFVRYRPLATGVVFAAAGLGIMGMPVLCRYLLNVHSWQMSLVIMACVTAHLLIAGAVLFPSDVSATGHGCGKIWKSCTRSTKRDMQDSRQNSLPLLSIDKNDCPEDSAAKTTHFDEEVSCAEIPDTIHTAAGSQKIRRDDDKAGSSVDTNLAELNDSAKTEEIVHVHSSESLNFRTRNCSGGVEADHCNSSDSVLGTARYTRRRGCEDAVEKQGTREYRSTDYYGNVNVKLNPGTRDERGSNEDLNRVDESLTLERGSLVAVKEVDIVPNSSGEGDRFLPENDSDSNKTFVNNVETSRSTLSKYVFALTSPSLVLICLELFLYNAAIGIVLVHFVTFCLERGSDFDTVSLSFSAHGLTLIVARVLAGMMGQDRNIDPLAVFVGLALVTSLVIVITPVIAVTAPVQIAVMALLGIYSTAGYSVLTEITIHCTGVDTLSVAFGLEMICAGLGFLVAPPIADRARPGQGPRRKRFKKGEVILFLRGWLVDITGSYSNAIFLAGFLHFLAAFAGMAVSLTRPKWIPESALTDKEISIEELSSKGNDV